MVQNSQDKEVTLAAFIEDNYRLLSALGIFVALTLFASNLPLKSIGYSLSFLFVSATVLIMLELWERFPSKSGTSRLFWFENVLFLSALLVVAYWFLEFRAMWHQYLIVPILGILLWLSSAAIKRFDVFNRLFRTEPGGRKILRYFFGFALVAVVIVVSWILAEFITPPINVFLDEVRRYLESTAP